LLNESQGLDFICTTPVFAYPYVLLRRVNRKKLKLQVNALPPDTYFQAANVVVNDLLHAEMW